VAIGVRNLAISNSILVNFFNPWDCVLKIAIAISCQPFSNVSYGSRGCHEALRIMTQSFFCDSSVASEVNGFHKRAHVPVLRNPGKTMIFLPSHVWPVQKSQVDAFHCSCQQPECRKM
jgi:hypothetical protein